MDLVLPVEVTPEHFCFDIPSIILLVGSTGSGKTSFLNHLCSNRNTTFKSTTKQPGRLVLCTGVSEQAMYTKLKEEFSADNFQVEHYSNFPTEILQKSTYFNPEQLNFLIIDDLMTEICANKQSATFFCKLLTVLSHHYSIVVIVVIHSFVSYGGGASQMVYN